MILKGFAPTLTLGYSSKPNSKGKIVLEIGWKLSVRHFICMCLYKMFTTVPLVLDTKLPVALNQYNTASNPFIQFYRNKGVSSVEFKIKPIDENFIVRSFAF